MRQLEAGSTALREELQSAGETIETLATDFERAHLASRAPAASAEARGPRSGGGERLEAGNSALREELLGALGTVLERAHLASRAPGHLSGGEAGRTPPGGPGSGPA